MPDCSCYQLWCRTCSCLQSLSYKHCADACKIMKRTIFLLAVYISAALVVSGFTIENSADSKSYTAQPTAERMAQDVLPQAHDNLWTTLYKTKISTKNAGESYEAVFPDEVKKLDGTLIKISGFILPLESEEKFKHFLLSKRTPTCFYCPPGEPNEIIEVFADKATEWEDDLVVYQGKFQLVNNQEQGIFFKLTEAKKAD